MRCRACDTIKAVRRSDGEYYCHECYGIVRDSLKDYEEDVESFEYTPYTAEGKERVSLPRKEDKNGIQD